MFKQPGFMKEEKLRYIKERLQHAPAMLASKSVFAGLDGFVDSIVKVIDSKTEDGNFVYFHTIEAFGAYISGKKGSGFSLETEELFQRLGGNMPIMANAMAQMGLPVDCVGALGVPDISPVFVAMHPLCKLHSFTNPGFTTAMEFTDGKMMLAQMTELNHADWNTVKKNLGLQKLIALYLNSDLVCLLNWSELAHSNEIWKGLQDEVFVGSQDSKPKQFFIDLSDCSKRSTAEIKVALDLVKNFRKYGKVTLSLNHNETNILYKTCINEDLPSELQIKGQHLFDELAIDTLIIHSAKVSLAWDQQGKYANIPDFIEEPLMLTGAGDNFNAGYCMAQLLDLDKELSLVLANMISNIYISTAQSPDLPVLNNYISGLLTANNRNLLKY